MCKQRALKYREGVHSGGCPQIQATGTLRLEKSASWHSPLWTSSLGSWTRACDVELQVSALGPRVCGVELHVSAVGL